MNAQNLRKLLENSNNKFNIFEDRHLLSQYNLNVNELLELVSDFLSDGEKAKLLKTDFIKNHDMKSFEILEIFKTLSDENKHRLLSNSEYIVQELQLQEYQIKDIVADLESEKIKSEMIVLYKLKNFQIVDILITFSDESKITSVLENGYDFDKYDLEKVVSTLSIDSLVDFFRENKDFLVKNDMNPYRITRKLSQESQLDFVSKFEDIGLSLGEKRQILATLNQKAKNNIDTANFPPEYVTAIKMQIGDNLSDIIVNLNEELEIYRDLDKLISINPIELSTEDKLKFLQLCEICPAISIDDNMGYSQSTAEEYRSAEIWIESILQEINEEWTDIQKVAFIDNAIGKKISYSPDFDTEVFDDGDARALWKIIHSGHGVCNGIAQVEKYILGKVKIESEMVSSGRHVFLKLKDIELPNADGGVITGDTILDPTWNLTAHRYGTKPENFCRSYEEIRKHDIKEDGTDAECHKNDKAFDSLTLDLDEKSLRQIFTSVGIADSGGYFPIKTLIDKSKTIDDYNFPAEESIRRQLSLLAEYCPEFLTCQNSTLDILRGVILSQKNLKFNRCVANRVYDREDKDKTPVIYVYTDLPESGKKFYFADRDTGKFLELPQKEFESRFECYEKDMDKLDKHRPWEDIKIKEMPKNLNQSSGRVIGERGDDR